VLGLALAVVPRFELWANQTKTISSVQVQTDDGVTRVVLAGAKDVMYTAFLAEDPHRLILDLPNVLFDGVETPIRVDDGIVTDVVLGSFGDAGLPSSVARVSIGLSATSEYEVVPQAEQLVVTLTSGVPAAASEAPQAGSMQMATAQGLTPEQAMPQAPMRDADGHSATSESEAAAPETPEADAADQADPGDSAAHAGADDSADTANASEETTAKASRIVDVKASGDNVEVRSEGPIDNVDSFVLENPDRIVIDLWGAKNGVSSASQPVQQGSVERIRVGEHPDKVRVVLDLRVPVETHVVAPTSNGVRVEIEAASTTVESDSTVAQDDTVPAAPAEESFENEPATIEVRDSEAVEVRESESIEMREPAAAASDTSEMADNEMAESETDSAREPGAPVEVESVHFESMPEVDRVVVTLTGKTEANLVQPDAATVIVDLPGVMITPNNERRVDTREFSGPVEVFSAFRSPEIPGKNLRVVMRRRGNTTPRLDWDGPQLRIEVPRPHSASAPETAMTATVPSSEPAAAQPTDGAAGYAASPGSEIVPAALPAAKDELYGGPADPASIDVLEEGGFSGDKVYRGRRISLDFKDADIGNILRLIAEVSDLNIIAGEEVAGNVTIRMVDVPWDQALDVVLLTKGLGFLRIGNILRIAPIDVLQREEEARLKERRAKEKLEDLVVKLQPVNYANVGEVAGLVKRLLSPRGTVNVDGRTSTLIIKDIPTVIQEATALVKAIDTATPQVLIEAKIVEASLDFSRSLGARWGIGFNSLGSQGGAQDLHLGDGSNSVVPGSGVGGLQQSNFVVANPISAAIGTLTLGLLGLDDHLQLDLQIQAAENKNKGKVISSPRVVTLDNREAVIQQGVAIAFTAEDGDSINTSFVDAVLELRVRPHITADKSIIMDIKVSRNAPQLSDASGAVVGIAKNETKTEALVRDGQTMVLGGIYTVDKGRGRTKMPFLADIPVLGVAFRNSTHTDIRRELLVFVTPRIVEGLPGS
jgi:type IV pilus assembly protein PilQ